VLLLGALLFPHPALCRSAPASAFFCQWAVTLRKRPPFTEPYSASILSEGTQFRGEVPMMQLQEIHKMERKKSTKQHEIDTIYVNTFENGR
jgi:hypothetical protein